MRDLEIVVKDSSGEELYTISLRTEGMEDSYKNRILNAEDPRSIYENWILMEMTKDGLSDSSQRNVHADVKSYLQDLDEKLASVDREHSTEWREK